VASPSGFGLCILTYLQTPLKARGQDFNELRGLRRGAAPPASNGAHELMQAQSRKTGRRRLLLGIRRASWRRARSSRVYGFGQSADHGRDRDPLPRPRPRPRDRRALQLDTLAAILPMGRRDRLAELLTDDDVATLRHLAQEGMGENTLRALASDLAYLEAGPPLRPAPPALAGFGGPRAEIPVEALREWPGRGDIAKGPVFRAIDRWNCVEEKALTPQSINLIVKRRCSLAGLEANEFSAHGLRSGYLTEAARQGRGATGSRAVAAPFGSTSRQLLQRGGPGEGQGGKVGALGCSRTTPACL
jgi:hypothetical protein